LWTRRSRSLSLSSRPTPQVFCVERLELAFKPKPWPLAAEKRAEIDAFWAELTAKNPALWNGRVLLLYRQVVSEGVFRGDYLETDYASFLAWRRWGTTGAGVHDCFSAAAIVSSDGALLLGEMGVHTANAGAIYFPCGTPDPSDIVGDRVDLEASVARELKEETGFEIGEFEAEPGWTTVVDRQLVVQIKTLRSTLSVDELRARMLAHLASEQQPELSDIHIVHGRDDYVPAMPPFVIAFLDEHFSASPDL
jgi:8-oxo-dGTP pyrophosphatase MutT (NUDIX family)